MNLIMLFSILPGFVFNCNGQKIMTLEKQKEEKFNLMGKWKIVKRVYADEKYTYTKKEEIECSGNIVIFYEDSIVSSKDTCFYGIKCYAPNYQIQKVNAYSHYEGDTSYMKLIGITGDSIRIISTDCGVPYAFIDILNENFICCGMDNYTVFLQRVVTSVENLNQKSALPAVGDTVLCKYRETSGECTGYIIQGTRKSGKVVHVNPVNKNVPLEIEEEKDKNKK